MQFGDVMERMVALQHRFTINEAVIYYLEQHLPNDPGEPPKELLVQDSCLVPKVPDSAFEAVLDELYEQNTKLDLEMVSLRELKIHEPKAVSQQDQPERNTTDVPPAGGGAAAAGSAQRTGGKVRKVAPAERADSPQRPAAGAGD